MIIKLRNDLIINFDEIIENEFYIFDNFQLKFNKISIPIEFKQYIELLIVGIEYKGNLFFINSKLLDEHIDINNLTNIVLELDKYLLLENIKSSNKLIEFYNYSKLINRPNICEDILYSSNEPKFIRDISHILKQKKLDIKNNFKSDFNLIFAPHLDYYSNQNVTEAYANIFNYISDLEYDLVVYLGTAHFVNSSLFMLCDKNYSTPLNNTFTDNELINNILDDCSKALNNKDVAFDKSEVNEIEKYIKIDNLAHKDEHSIELHNTFISFLNKESQINILPILTGSFDEKLDQNIYDTLTNIIKNNIKAKYKKVLFLSSGDMSHIGVKFGDLSNKNDNLNKIKDNKNYYNFKKDNYINFEKEVIKTFIDNDLNQYKTIMFKKNKDFRICGFAPFYSGLYFFPGLKGTLIDHYYTENLNEEFLVSYTTMIFT